eukprot:11765294-Karenia_brevis.AAC.1
MMIILIMMPKFYNMPHDDDDKDDNDDDDDVAAIFNELLKRNCVIWQADKLRQTLKDIMVPQCAQPRCPLQCTKPQNHAFASGCHLE